MKTNDEISVDLQLHDLVTQAEKGCEIVALDASFRMPKCLRCPLKCPGYEKCQESEILWMWDLFRRRSKIKKPNKLFTPYTERCVEMFLSGELEEPFHLSHALGANGAPLTARANFIRRRFKKITLIETRPQVSLWRIARDLGIGKGHLRLCRHTIRGESLRKIVLDEILKKELVFVYKQDEQILATDIHIFDAFFSALTAVLKYLNLCEPRPKGFPRGADWVEFPQKNVFSRPGLE